MANQTVSVNRNFDDAAISGLLNGEDITINTGARLTINSDVRWSQQAAVIGAISIDAATGGSVLIDGRDVWWIPYDAGTGNVPALGTLGVQNCTGSGGATGEFLGIFTALGVAPTAAAAAMPATGFIKFRSKVGDFADDEVITLPGGATVTVNSTTGGQRGWLHIVGETATTITVPRLGLFETQGDWFELGTTNGADNQTFQFPVADYCNGIQIETAPGSGVYEWWPTAGTTRWGQNNRIAQDVRGKLCNCTAAGVIQIAVRGAVNNGYKPPSGCRVRVPNIIVSTSSTANWALNLFFNTTASWDFTTTSAGAILLNKVSSTWWSVFAQPFSVECNDSSFQGTLNISECASEVIIRRCCVGIATNVDYSPISLTSCFSGATIEDTVTAKYEYESNDVADQFIDCDSISVLRHKVFMFGDNTAATLTRGATNGRAFWFNRVTNSEIDDIAVIGASLEISGSTNITVSNVKYAECIENRTTNATSGIYAIVVNGVSNNIQVDGFSNFESLANVHPYNGIISFTNAYGCELRNVGTPTAPYNAGSSNAMGLIAAFLGNDTDNIIRRVYVDNTRTGAISTINSSFDGRAINVWGDGADTIAIASNNFLTQGCRGTRSTTGQTSVYGTHWSDHFSSTTAGVIRVHANEPTASTIDQCAITSGTAQFTSTGQVGLRTVGDQVEWTLPYFALGHTSLASLEFNGTNQANHTLEFQYDLGSGFNGTWLAITTPNLTGVGAIDPAVGIKLKIRATCAVASATNAITYITINTVTDAVSQRTQYPLPGIQLTLTGLVAGSEVRAYQGTDPATAIEIGGVESSGTSFTVEYTTAAGEAGYIVVFGLGYQPIRIPITYPSTNSSIPIQQVIDRVYENPV
jgi:hypothetical protein